LYHKNASKVVARPRAKKVTSDNVSFTLLSPTVRLFGSRSQLEFAFFASLIAIFVFLAGSFSISGLTWDETLSYITETISTLSDPDPEDLRSVLPLWSSFSQGSITNDIDEDNQEKTKDVHIVENIDKVKTNVFEEDNEEVTAILDKHKNEDISSSLSLSSSSYSSPVLTRGGILVQPRATLVLGWENTLADPTCYDAKRGRYTAFRPGFADLLLSCANANIEIMIWSRDYPSAAVAEDLHSFIQQKVIPQDKSRYNEFASFLRTSRARAIAAEHHLAKMEGRAAREVSSFIEEIDTQPLYERSILRLAAVLGREHCYSRSRALGLVLSRRSLSSVLVIDSKQDLAEKEWKDAVQLHKEEGRLMDNNNDDLMMNNHVKSVEEINKDTLENVRLVQIVKEGLECIYRR
jgi:hypothetical protein